MWHFTFKKSQKVQIKFTSHLSTTIEICIIFHQPRFDGPFVFFCGPVWLSKWSTLSTEVTKCCQWQHWRKWDLLEILAPFLFTGISGNLRVITPQMDPQEIRPYIRLHSRMMVVNNPLTYIYIYIYTLYRSASYFLGGWHWKSPRFLWNQHSQPLTIEQKFSSGKCFV